MGEAKFSLSVQPGVLAAVLFIGLDIVTLGILDIVLSRIVCMVYYRKINRGRPVSVKSADIPGLTNYLLGKFFSLTNLVALGVKLSLLAVVFVVNLRIDSEKGFGKVPQQRSALFDFDPSDAELGQAPFRTVRRRPESSKACVKEDEEDRDKLTYYQLAFNLRNDVRVANDLPTGAEGESAGMYDIDDTSIVCMSPENVHNERPIAVVTGCTRRPASGCLTVLSENAAVTKNWTARVVSNEVWTNGPGEEPTHTLTKYDEREVREQFKEYKDPKLTCMTTFVGVQELGGISRYRQCLLVVNEGWRTIVERWIVERADGGSASDEPDENNGSPIIMRLSYPGVVFQGDVRIQERITALYLQTLFPFTTYRAVSGQLVAHGARYRGAEHTVVRNGEQRTVTTIPVWAVGLVVACVVVVVIGRVVTFIVLRNDKRPKFNTIDGLSSIVREECVPTGRSYDAGESAVLGLRYTTDDLLHFGPMAEHAEGARYDGAHDIQ